ncbi:MAG: hypothetical protein KA791_02500 [Flavobacteriales bacterium]|nr:hypothetical protein [Flavobacteriales bacterium]
MRNASLRLWLPWTIGVLVTAIAWWALRPSPLPGGLRVTMEVNTSCTDVFQLYWDDGTGRYTPERVSPALVSPDIKTQRVRFILPESAVNVQGLRFDPGTQAVRMDLVAIELQGPYRTERLECTDIAERFAAAHDLEVFDPDTNRNVITLKCTGGDPYFASTQDLRPIIAAVMDGGRPLAGPLLLAGLIGGVCALVLSVVLRPKAAHTPRERHTSEPAPPAALIVAATIAIGLFFLGKGIANNVNFRDRALVVEMEVSAFQEDNFQIFYSKKPGGFSQGYYVNSPVQAARGHQLLNFRMPSDTLFRFLRFDPGNKQDSLHIHSMTLRCNDEALRFNAAELHDLFKTNEHVQEYGLRDSTLCIRFRGNDPFLYCDKDIGEDVRALWESSGNGPLPFWTGIVCAIAGFAGLAGNKRLASLLTSARPVEMATGLLFCAMISLPMLSELLPLEPFVADTEKRPLAEKPLLRLHSLEEFPDKHARFYSDHFGYRKMLFRWNSLFHTYVLHCSSMPDNLVFGKDGYLFLIKPGVEKFYRHLPVFTEAEMQRIAARLDHRKKWLADRGIDYYLIVPPLKATMYPEKLPDKFRKVDDRSELDDLKDYLDEHCSVKLIDIRHELAEAKKTRDIYYTTDIHWNPWGGFVGYRALMKEMLKDHPELGSACRAGDYTVRADTNDNGDLAMQIALNDKLTRVTYMMIPKVPFRAQPLPEEALPASAFFKYKPVFTMGPDPQAPKLLMFRDSFAVYLMPYLNEHFSRSVYVWTPILIPDIVEKEKPDIVVQEIMELFLPDLLEDKLTDPL